MFDICHDLYRTNFNQTDPIKWRLPKLALTNHKKFGGLGLVDFGTPHYSDLKQFKSSEQFGYSFAFDAPTLWNAHLMTFKQLPLANF